VRVEVKKYRLAIITNKQQKRERERSRTTRKRDKSKQTKLVVFKLNPSGTKKNQSPAQKTPQQTF
jgi:hypothetical protein